MADEPKSIDEQIGNPFYQKNKKPKGEGSLGAMWRKVTNWASGDTTPASEPSSRPSQSVPKKDE